MSFKVVGLDCSGGVNLLRRALERRSGILDLKFDLLQGKMTIMLDSRSVNHAQILLWIKELGMEVTLCLECGREEEKGLRGRYIRLIANILSGVTLCIALFFHLQNMRGAETLYFIAIFLGCYFSLPKAYLSIRHMHPDMHLLIIVAISGAIGLGKWCEVATVAFLFSTALSLEHWSLGRARRVLAELMDLSPN